MIEKVSENKRWFFEKINFSQTDPRKKKITNIWNEIGL